MDKTDFNYFIQRTKERLDDLVIAKDREINSSKAWLFDLLIRDNERMLNTLFNEMEE